MKKSVIENIHISPALLTRFDLIYILLDLPSEPQDRAVARHILEFYAPTSQKQKSKPYDMQLISKYITYAKAFVHPVISQKAGEKLVKSYCEMRKMGESRKTVTSTPRQLESLIRISEAFAKMRLSNEVTLSDVDDARDLLESAMLMSAVDPDTGLIDVDVLIGRASSLKGTIEELAKKVKGILIAREGKYKNISCLEMLEEDLRRLGG